MKESYKKVLKLIGEELKAYIKNYTPIRILRGVLNFALSVIKNTLIMTVAVYVILYLVHLMIVKQIIPIDGIKRLAEMPAEDVDALFLRNMEKILNWTTAGRLANIFFPAAILYYRGKSILAFLYYCLKQRTINAYLILIASTALILLYIHAITNNYVDRSSLYTVIYGGLIACIAYLPELLTQERFKSLTGKK
ncbi:MAG: hypothetical protein ACYC2U_00085 [Candidatus Amoebophilus sp.]